MFDVLIQIRMFPLAKRKQDRGKETVVKVVKFKLILATWTVFTRAMQTEDWSYDRMHLIECINHNLCCKKTLQPRGLTFTSMIKSFSTCRWQTTQRISKGFR
jgi:hypothetical protein